MVLKCIYCIYWRNLNIKSIIKLYYFGWWVYVRVFRTGCYCPAGICPAAICPGGICPRTINDICNVSHLCTLLYADDTSVVENDKNFDKLLEILNDELNKLSIWLKANK